MNKIMGDKNLKVKDKRALFIICISVLILSIVCSIVPYSTVTMVEAQDKDKIMIEYYYDSACGSCNEDLKFYDLLNQEIGEYTQITDVNDEKPYKVSTYNIFKSGVREIYEKRCKELSVNTDEEGVPLVVINDSYISGKTDIEENLKPLYLKEAGISDSADKGNVASENNKDNDDKNLNFDETGKPFYSSIPKESNLVYFYTSNCADCEKTLEFYKGLEDTYSSEELSIDYKNILDPQNLELVQTLFAKYEVKSSEQEVPIVFYKDGYLSGADDIKGKLRGELEQGKAKGEVTHLDTQGDIGSVSIIGVIVTGFINGFNPCSISMILFLFSLLVAKNVNVLKISIFYIAGKFISYLLIGMGIYLALGVIQTELFNKVSVVIGIVLAVVCVILAVLNLFDYFAAKNEKYQNIKVQLPSFLRKFNNNIIKYFSDNMGKKMLLVGSFVLGFVISIGEFLCTGQIYLATILSLFNTGTVQDMQAFLLFVLYAACMSVPFLIFAILISKGKKVLMVSEGFRKIMPYVKLINAGVFIVFAVFTVIKLL